MKIAKPRKVASTDQKRISKTRQDLVARFDLAIRAFCPNIHRHMVKEHRFHPARMWRLDFAFPDQEIGIELQGGTWVNGGHNRGAQMSKDYEKLNAAQAIGWKVFQFSTDMLRNDPKACADLIGNQVELRDKF